MGEGGTRTRHLVVMEKKKRKKNLAEANARTFSVPFWLQSGRAARVLETKHLWWWPPWKGYRTFTGQTQRVVILLLLHRTRRCIAESFQKAAANNALRRGLLRVSLSKLQKKRDCKKKFHWVACCAVRVLVLSRPTSTICTSSTE